MRRLLLGCQCQRAQTVLEFALIAPIAFVLLFGIIDFGIAFSHRVTIEHAVREGARYAAVNADPDAIRERTSAQSRGLVDASVVEVCYEPGPKNTGTLGFPGDYVKVTAPATYGLTIIGRGLELIGGSVGPINLTTHGDARLELRVSNAEPCD